ncbi:hypothetical protein ABPG72_013505 [Tetrahymena utriculariae]
MSLQKDNQIQLLEINREKIISIRTNNFQNANVIYSNSSNKQDTIQSESQCVDNIEEKCQQETRGLSSIIQAGQAYLEHISREESYFSQIQQLCLHIEEYNFIEYEKCMEYSEQPQFKVLKQIWSEEIFNQANKKQFYLSKIIFSNEKEDVILGFSGQKPEEFIFNITNQSVQQEIESYIQIIQTLNMYVELIQIEPQKCSVLVMQKKDFFLVQNNFQLLTYFQGHISELEDCYEINSKTCQYCNACDGKKFCMNFECFKNIKSRILAFFQNRNYQYCEFTDKQIDGVIFKLNLEEIKISYLEFIYDTIFGFLKQKNTNLQNVHQLEAILLFEKVPQQQFVSETENKSKQAQNLQLVSEYQFEQYRILDKQNSNREKKKYKMKWDKGFDI